MTNPEEEQRYKTVKELREKGFGGEQPQIDSNQEEGLDPKQFGTRLAEELLEGIETALRK